MPRLPSRWIAASPLLAVAVAALVALDLFATRRELLGLLREQADAVGHTLAAAARSNRAAARVAEAQLAARMLDQARYLRELDRAGALRPGSLPAIGSDGPLLRINVLGPDGSREHGSGPGRGPGRGRGWGGGALAARLLAGESEAVTDAHAGRDGGERLAAGVRRAGGGAIVVTADAGAIAELQRPASLQALLADAAESVAALAYAELEQGGERIAQGPLPEGPGCPAPSAEREVRLDGRPVLEVCSAVPLGEGETGQLRLGLRLDAVRETERRLLLRLGLSLLAAVAFTGLALGTLSLRHDHAALSRRHALAEEALRRRDRLLAMGELASTVAHEVRNPLNAIAMSAQRLRREFPGPVAESERQERDELLAVLVDETRRIDRIVRQFLDFARPPRLALGPQDLGALAAEVVESLRPLAAARGVELRCGAARAGTATLDADQMRQALSNVVRNAVEATGQGGHVRVTASSGPDGHALEVEDDGPGIPPEALPRIFDLYFTTKAEGTGVGLAVTHQVLTAHGGRVEVDSRPGGGTRLALRFPEAAT